MPGFVLSRSELKPEFWVTINNSKNEQDGFNNRSTNVIGLMDVTKVVLPWFRKQRSGVIINISSYQPLVGKVMAAFPEFFKNASPASVVADVIYAAATDGSDKLRYTAGEDAKGLIASRKELDDETFTGAIKSQFGF